MSHPYTTHPATLIHKAPILHLSILVQASLRAKGSKQIIGPSPEKLHAAITDRLCFILLRNPSPLSSEETENADGIQGCILFDPIPSLEAFPVVLGSLERDAEGMQKPWFYMHSVMVRPEIQGGGVGREMVEGVLRRLSKRRGDGETDGVEGTVFLDCWEGNEKLRRFYEGCGFRLIGIVAEEDWTVSLYWRKI